MGVFDAGVFRLDVEDPPLVLDVVVESEQRRLHAPREHVVVL
jgi:hypothetical protein